MKTTNTGLAYKCSIRLAYLVFPIAWVDNLTGHHQGILDRINFVLLLLLLSHFNRVRLCATPSTKAHQAPPSLGFPKLMLIIYSPYAQNIQSTSHI